MFPLQDNWTNHVKKVMIRKEWEKWRTTAATKDALMLYKKIHRHGPEPFLQDNKAAKAFCQARIGDGYRLAGVRNSDNIVTCSVCHKKVANIIFHVIEMCKNVETMRSWNRDMTTTPWARARKALNNCEATHVNKVGNLLLT